MARSLGVTRRLFVCSASGCLKAFAQRPRERTGETRDGGEDIEFDPRSLQEMLQWARGESPEPTDWRRQRPYELATGQAKWNGRPDPNDEVYRQVMRIRRHGGDAPIKESLEGTARLLDAVLNGREEFAHWAVPHLHTYLPTGTPIRGVVAMAAFLPNYAFSMNGTIVVSLTDRFWTSASLVFNLLVHELFHNGFVQHQRGESPNDAGDGHDLVQALLWQVQNEGLATYVAYRAKPADLVYRDYELLEQPVEVMNRFAQCRNLLADLKAASRQTLPALRERLWRECNLARVSYVAGASMAERIERLNGVAALVRTIVQGPTAFLDTYRRTSPAPELRL